MKILAWKFYANRYVKNNFEFLKDLNLADSGTVEEIDMLIDSDFYWSLVTEKVKMGKTGEPVAIKTKFGWVLNEPLNEKASQGHVTVVNEMSRFYICALSPLKFLIQQKLKV